jgi:hypothetical protein
MLLFVVVGLLLFVVPITVHCYLGMVLVIGVVLLLDDFKRSCLDWWLQRVIFSSCAMQKVRWPFNIKNSHDSIAHAFAQLTRRYGAAADATTTTAELLDITVRWMVYWKTTKLVGSSLGIPPAHRRLLMHGTNSDAWKKTTAQTAELVASFSNLKEHRSMLRKACLFHMQLTISTIM